MLDQVLGFLQALTINLSIGLTVVVLALTIGFVTAVVRLGSFTLGSRSMNFLIGVLRTAPSYVLLFVVAATLKATTEPDTSGGTIIPLVALLLALLAGALASCSDACVTFLQYRALGQTKQAWLIVPNIFQVFIVAVMTSGTGAVIGVHEAVHYTLALADTYETRVERIVLVGVVILFFAGLLGFAKFLSTRLSAHLSARFSEKSCADS